MTKTSGPLATDETLQGISPVFQDVIHLTRLGGMLSRPFFQTYAQNYALTLNEWRVMVIAHAMPGVAGQDVSRHSGIHPMNVSRAVSSLREAGRITSEQDPENHRRQLLRLTPAGEQLYRELFPSAQLQAERLFSVLDEDERRTFATLLDRLFHQAEAIMDQGEDEVTGGAE